jgi:hypothetical protein
MTQRAPPLSASYSSVSTQNLLQENSLRKFLNRAGDVLSRQTQQKHDDLKVVVSPGKHSQM